MFLTLLACNPFAKTRSFECHDHSAINVKYEGAIDARALSEAICVNTVMRPYRYFDQPDDAFYREGDASRTVAAMMLDTPFVEYGTEVDQAQFMFTREENETTSIHGPGGLTVLSDGDGMVALRGGAREVVIDCDDCDVWIPQGPERLDLTMNGGTARICLAGTTDLSLHLTKVTIEATVAQAPAKTQFQLSNDTQVILHGVDMLPDWIPPPTSRGDTTRGCDPYTQPAEDPTDPPL